MPDSQDNLREDHRPDILKDLDDINTADMSSGIMQGILNEQNELDSKLRQFQDQQEPEEKPDQKAKVDDKDDKEQVDHYAPLNTSIQQLRQSNEQKIARLEQQIQHLASSSAQAADAARSPAIDPETPLVYKHVEPIANALEEARRQNYHVALRSEYNRAQMEYLHFKQAHPDFNVSPQDVQEAFAQHVGNDLGKAMNTNWTGVFSIMREQTAGPARAKEVEDLKKEIESLKSQLKRPQHEAKTQQVSSSLRPSGGRAVQSPLNESRSDDVVHLPSFRKGKSFKNYGREIIKQGLF